MRTISNTKRLVFMLRFYYTMVSEQRIILSVVVPSKVSVK